jgi:2-methylcitrate dehydratase PrpD
VVDDSVPEHAAVAQMRTSDGEQRSVVIDHATGSLQNPMTPEMLEAKFRAVVSPVLGEERVPVLLEQLWSLEKAPDLRSLLELSVRGAGASR